MSSKNTNNSYGWVSKLFHWGMLIIIFGQYYIAANMKEMKWGGIHMSVGVLILLLMLARFIWRAKNPVPELPEGTGKLQALGAHGLHILFYALLIAMPIAGIAIVQSKGFPVSFFGMFSLPTIFSASESGAELASTIHGIFAKSILAAILLHLLMALFHHFVKKDNVLKRMLPGGK